MNTLKQTNPRKREYDRRLKEMQEVVMGWNLTQIYEYVMCKNDEHVCNFLGFVAIMDKFNDKRVPHKDFPKGRREFESTDLPERLRKGFDIVVFLTRHPRSNIKTMVGIQKFIKVYMDVIREYDKKMKENYREKILHAFHKGLIRMEQNARAAKHTKKR